MDKSMGIMEKVKSFLRKNDIVDIKLTNEYKGGSAASYEFGSNTIGINEEGIKKEAIQLGVSIEDAITLIISHELGHYLDTELPELFSKKRVVMDEIARDIIKCNLEDKINETTTSVIIAEKNAWSLGEKFVPIYLVPKYHDMQKETLKRQENATKRELHNYISLVIEKEKLKSRL